MIKEPFPHKHFNSAEGDLEEAMSLHRPGRLIGIVGLPGNGKTFLRNLMLRRAVGAPESWGVGKLAMTEVMALMDNNSRFSAKGFAARAHRAVLRPDLRALYRDASDDIQEAYLRSLREAEDVWKRSFNPRTATESNYWDSFAEAAVERELKFLAVEHAAAIGRPPKDEEPKDHMWNLMSVLERIGAMGVLNLIPEGHVLWEGRPEIAERMDLVFIKPYDLNDQDEITEFARVVLYVASRYRLEDIDVLRNRILEIGIATATGMRAIEQFFARAGANARNRGCPTINDKDLMNAMETETHITALWKQVSLFNKICKPADERKLMAIHENFLAPDK